MKKGFVLSLIPLGLLIIAVLIWSALVFDPRSAETDDTTETIYFADHISPSSRRAIEMFNERHLGRIRVEPVDLPFEKFSTNERKELLTRSLRSKSQKLDVFAVDLIWVSRFAKWAEPLGPTLSDEQRQGIIPIALQSCYADSALVALPMYIDIGLMYYRRDIIARLPDADEVEAKLQRSITWDEMLLLRQRLGYEARPFYMFQGKPYEGLVCNFIEVARGADPNVLSTNSMDLMSAGAVRSVQLLRSFITKGVTPSVITDFDENLSYAYMLDHDAVFVRGWPNFVENFRRTYPDTFKLSLIGRAPLPHFAGNGPSSVFGGWNLMVSGLSAHKEASKIFIHFLQSEEVQKMMFEEGGYIPVAEAVYRDEAFMAKHPVLRFYRSLMERGFHRPQMVEYTRISDIISRYVHDALRGEISPETAMREAQRAIDSNGLPVQ